MGIYPYYFQCIGLLIKDKKLIDEICNIDENNDNVLVESGLLFIEPLNMEFMIIILGDDNIKKIVTDCDTSASILNHNNGPEVLVTDVCTIPIDFIQQICEYIDDYSNGSYNEELDILINKIVDSSIYGNMFVQTWG